jgi:transcription antitermination factor NusG
MQLQDNRVPLPDPIWYAIQTVPCQEGVAATWLRRAGFWATYPLDRFQALQRRPLGRSMVTWIDRPHFVGYIFLALRYIGESLAPVNDTRGVVRVVCRPLSGEPLTIPIPIMDAILDERLFALDDERGAIVMSETHLHGDRELRVFLSSLGRWKTEPVHQAAVA